MNSPFSKNPRTVLRYVGDKIADRDIRVQVGTYVRGMARRQKCPRRTELLVGVRQEAGQYKIVATATYPSGSKRSLCDLALPEAGFSPEDFDHLLQANQLLTEADAGGSVVAITDRKTGRIYEFEEDGDAVTLGAVEELFKDHRGQA